MGHGTRYKFRLDRASQCWLIYDEQGKEVGSSRFLYVRAALLTPQGIEGEVAARPPKRESWWLPVRQYKDGWKHWPSEAPTERQALLLLKWPHVWALLEET